jgi:FHA domain
MATVDVSYVPGGLTAVTGDQCWALVEASPDSPAVSRIWQQLGQGTAADALLAGLVADGLGSMTGFTLLVAEADGRHRLFCRGAVGATVVNGAADGNGQAASERIAGTGLLTWREQAVDGAALIFLGEPPADTALRLPATSGVLLAGCVIVDLTNAAARKTVAYDEGPPAPQQPQQEQGQEQGQGRPKKTIVFFPDTITMTHPGSLADQAAAPSMPMAAAPAGAAAPVGSPGSQGWPDAPGSGAFPAQALPAGGGLAAVGPAGPAKTVADGPAWPPAEGDPASFAPAGAPMTGGYAGQGGQPPAQYQAAPPQSWRPVADEAWSGGPRPGGPLTGPAQPPAPMPGRPQNPPGGLPSSGMPPNGMPPNGMPPNGMPPAPAGGLIDAPPWLSGPGGPGPAGQTHASGVPTGHVPLGTPPAGPVPPAAGTVGAPYQPAAPRPESGPGESGNTVKRGELHEFAAVTTPPDRIGPVVPALLCPSGHVNPPSGATCRRCGAPLPHDPVPVPRPVLGVLRLSLGDVITLDRGVLMGRNPRTDFSGPDGFVGAGGEERPHVVKLPSADGDISRTHLRVTLDGWHVLVTDLNSTNGTLITLPGRDPQQLRPGEPVPIQPGTVVTLADGIDFRYEVAE